MLQSNEITDVSLSFIGHKKFMSVWKRSIVNVQFDLLDSKGMWHDNEHNVSYN